MKRGPGALVLAGGAAAAALAACGSAGDATPGEREPARVAVEVELAIGELDGPDLYVFGRITGAAMDDAGRVFVADGQANEVRVFSPAGEFLFAIARAGAGPGEVGSPCCLAFGPDGRFWLRDVGNARYNAYHVGEAGAEFARSVRMAHGGPGLWAALTFDGDGHLIDVGPAYDGEGTIQTTRFFLDSDGHPVREQVIRSPPPERIGQHTVDRMVGENRGRFFFYQPYGPRHLVDHGAGGDYAEAVGSEYAIRWFGADGALRHEIVRDDVGPPLSGAERDDARQRLEREAEFAGLRVGQLPYGIPDRKPVLAALRFDAEGRLWAFRETPGREPYRADVYERDGALGRVVEWPRDLSHQLAFIGAGHGVAVAVDDLGVQRLARFRLTLPADAR